MRECTANGPGRRCLGIATCGALIVAAAIGAGGCSTGTSLVAASAYRKASVYGTSKAYVEMAPEDAFQPGVAILAELEDTEITALDEDSTRCTAAHGDRVLTFRVFESREGLSRLSLLVGGGDDANANQELADRLMQEICGRLGTECETGSGSP
jgi:hypothetical protein